MGDGTWVTGWICAATLVRAAVSRPEAVADLRHLFDSTDLSPRAVRASARAREPRLDLNLREVNYGYAPFGPPFVPGVVGVLSQGRGTTFPSGRVVWVDGMEVQQFDAQAWVTAQRALDPRGDSPSIDDWPSAPADVFDRAAAHAASVAERVARELSDSELELFSLHFAQADEPGPEDDDAITDVEFT